jgi:hypothetical protein
MQGFERADRQLMDAAALAGHLVVTNQNVNSVTEYMKNARGNISPMATITGSGTGLSFPAGIAVAG